jgi:uncharacterized protein (DUF3820 family)
MKPEDLLLLVNQEMPYGKYKGRLMADLPGHYLAWFAREGFPPGEIGRLLALMHEIDHNGLSGLLTPLRPRKTPHQAGPARPTVYKLHKD